MGLFKGLRKALKKMGGADGDGDALSAIEKCAIVSVTMDHIGRDNEEGADFSQRLVDYAAEKAAEHLSERFGWDILPYDEIDAEAVTASVSLADNDEVREQLGDMLDRNEFPLEVDPSIMREMMQAMMQGPEAVAGLRTKIIDSAIDAFSLDAAEDEDLVVAKGLPTISYAAYNPKAAEGVREITFGGDNSEELVQDLRSQSFAGVAENLGVDAVIILYYRAVAEFTGDIGVISEDEDRLQGTIRMNPTIVVIDKNGDAALDAGFPGLDDLAPWKRTPLFKNEEGRPMDLTHERVWEEFCQLADKGADKVGDAVAAFIE